MPRKELHEALRSFWASTSIKGVPRAVHSQQLVTRICWGAATLACLAMLVWQTITLLVKYYQFSVTVTSRILDSTPTFPDVTVCNQKPYDVLAALDLTYSEYFARIAQLETQATSAAASDPALSVDYANVAFWSGLRLQRSYLVNNPFYSEIVPYTQANSSFVVDCTWFDWNIWPINVAPGLGLECLNNINVTWNPNYYNCYTIRAPVPSLMGFTIIFYISKFPTSATSPFMLDVLYSITAGMRVSIQNLNTYDEILQGFNLMPGKEVTVNLVQQSNSKLGLPFSPKTPCTTQLKLDEDDPSSPYSYSILACQSVCRQQAYINTCGCVTSTQIFTKRQLDSVNSTFCDSNLMPSSTYNSTDVLKVLKKTHCDYFTPKQAVKCDCQVPCQSDSYSWTISTANWPAVESHVAFYERYIKPHPEIYGNKFDAYDTVMKQGENLTTKQLLAKISAIGLIASNFIQLKFQLDRQSVDAVTEIPTVASDSLFSNLGGILNLWMGVTVLFAAEVIELLFTLAGVYCGRKEKAETESHDLAEGLMELKEDASKESLALEATLEIAEKLKA